MLVRSSAARTNESARWSLRGPRDVVLRGRLHRVDGDALRAVRWWIRTTGVSGQRARYATSVEPARPGAEREIGEHEVDCSAREPRPCLVAACDADHLVPVTLETARTSQADRRASSTTTTRFSFTSCSAVTD